VADVVDELFREFEFSNCNKLLCMLEDEVDAEVVPVALI
jgi:hypothetical protein